MTKNQSMKLNYAKESNKRQRCIYQFITSNGWNLFCMKVFETGIQILFGVPVSPGVHRP